MQRGPMIPVILLLTLYLGLSDGYLAVFRQGDPQPMQVLPYHSSLFPQEDRQALNKGIPFTSEAELSKLLEDFTS